MTSFIPATLQDRAALDNLMQLYAHDWSEIRALDVGENGRYADYPLDDYWQQSWRHPFLIRADGRLAGFALIGERSRLTGASGVFDMAEFFVLRRYRKKGIGMAAAFAAFDRFRGPWEIREREENGAATAFWRRVIDRYTGGKYQETHWKDATWYGPVQTFSSSEVSARPLE